MKPPTWLEPYRLVWESVCGEASFAAIAGQAAKFLRPLDKANGSERIAAHLARYLADSGPQYRSIARFAANWGAYAPGQVLARSTDDKATAALALVKRTMGAHSGPQFTPQSAWDAFDVETRAGISRAGGLRAIWESTNESGLVRAFTDGYRNGAHAH